MSCLARYPGQRQFPWICQRALTLAFSREAAGLDNVCQVNAELVQDQGGPWPTRHSSSLEILAVTVVPPPHTFKKDVKNGTRGYKCRTCLKLHAPKAPA
jgi:hypothetical protein